ncbi:MAG TPA: PIN domain-containing protein [Acidimicrobiales bacterium]|nr:PIN domain-containing protein [Acidimicrobiales bacterium]
MATRPRATGRRRALGGESHSLILDSGAVIALSRNDRRALARVADALAAGDKVVVPAIVLAETLRGRPADAPVHRVLRKVNRFPPADEVTCRVAASLLEAAGSSSTVDAVVVAVAIGLGGGVILTSDVGDLMLLADGRPEIVLARC